MAGEYVFNIAKGRVAELAALAAANDALIVVPLENAGLEAEAVLKDKDTLADVLSGTTNEQTTMGRKTVTASTITTDDSSDTKKVSIANPTWVDPAGNTVGMLIFCYDADTTSGTDANIIPLTAHPWSHTPDGTTDVIATINANGFFNAT